MPRDNRSTHQLIASTRSTAEAEANCAGEHTRKRAKMLSATLGMLAMLLVVFGRWGGRWCPDDRLSRSPDQQSIIDPDAQQDAHTMGEPRAGLRSDLTIDDRALEKLRNRRDLLPNRRLHDGTLTPISSARRRRTGRLAPARHARRARRRTYGGIWRGGRGDAPMPACGHRRIVALRNKRRDNHRGRRRRS